MANVDNTANVGYSKVSETLLNAAHLNNGVEDVLLKGNQASLSVDSTTAVDVVVSPALWKQAQVSQLLINNTAGAGIIDLFGNDNADADVNVGAIQAALGITLDGDVAAVRVTRTGASTSEVQIASSSVLRNISGFSATVYLETLNYSNGTGHMQVRSVSLDSEGIQVLQ